MAVAIVLGGAGIAAVGLVALRLIVERADKGGQLRHSPEHGPCHGSPSPCDGFIAPQSEGLL